MRYFLDTEFIEYPNTIDLISIGIRSQDDRNYYAESAAVNWGRSSDWVKQNVRPHLGDPGQRLWPSEIRDEILAFIGDDKPEFWGYYADYDWVVFCWLFGSMVDLPKGWPMYCRDIKQWADQLGNPKLPEQETDEHHALADAKWNKVAFDFLAALSTDSGASEGSEI